MWLVRDWLVRMVLAVSPSVTHEAIGPLVGVHPLTCPRGVRGRHRPAHFGDLIRRLPDP
jgi:hypothetical protein